MVLWLTQVLKFTEIQSVEIAIIATTILLIGSLSLNLILHLKLKEERKANPSDARRIIRDLYSYGAALVEIRQIEQKDIMIRSPRT